MNLVSVLLHLHLSSECDVLTMITDHLPYLRWWWDAAYYPVYLLAEFSGVDMRYFQPAEGEMYNPFSPYSPWQSDSVQFPG
jgi:hypothetical protein